MPGVDVTVPAAVHDLEGRIPARPVEVRQRRRAHDGAVRIVVPVLVLRQGEARVGLDGKARAELPVIVEHVELAFRGGHHDLDASVAVEVVCRRRGQDRLVGDRNFAALVARRGVHRDRVGSGGKARKLVARAAAKRVNASIGGAVDDVEDAVPIDIGEDRRSLAGCAEPLRREAERRVRVDGDRAPVFAESVLGIDHAQAERDGVGVGVGDRRAGIEAAGCGGVRRAPGGQRRLVEGRDGEAVADLRIGRRLDAAAHLHRVVEGAACAHGGGGADDGDVRRARGIDGVEPGQTAREIGLRRNRRGGEVEHPGDVGTAVARELVPAFLGRELRGAEGQAEGRGREQREQRARREGRVAAVVDVGGRRPEELAYLFGREGMRRGIARVGRQQPAVDEVAAVGDQQQRNAAGAARRLGGAAGGGDGGPGAAAVVGAAVLDRVVELLFHEGAVAVADGVDPERVLERRGIVVVTALLVGGAGDDRDAAPVGVVDGGLGDLGGADGAERLGDHRDIEVHGVDHRLGEVGIHGHEAVRHAQRHVHRAWRDAREPAAVVGLLDLVRRLAGSVAILDVIRGVVVLLIEVPAGDVVHEAVAIVVDAVGEGADHVLPVAKAVSVGIGHAGIVVDVHDPVAVAVVDDAAGRERELSRVERRRARELRGAPADAAVEHGHHDVRPAGAALPRSHDVHARPGAELPGVVAAGIEVVGQHARGKEEIGGVVGGVATGRRLAGGIGHLRPGGCGRHGEHEREEGGKPGGAQVHDRPSK